jgi:hypothetical protein
MTLAAIILVFAASAWALRKFAHRHGVAVRAALGVAGVLTIYALDFAFTNITFSGKCNGELGGIDGPCSLEQYLLQQISVAWILLMHFAIFWLAIYLCSALTQPRIAFNDKG